MQREWTSEEAARVFQGMIDAKREWLDELQRRDAEMTV